MCQKGQAVVRGIFEEPAADDLRGLIAWLPMLPGDNAESAAAQSTAFQDQRVVQGWDPQRQIGDMFAETLKLSRTAWDVYLLYPRDVTWENAEPPRPAFWMHQLTAPWGVDEKLRLDAARLTQAVLESLTNGQ